MIDPFFYLRKSVLVGGMVACVYGISSAQESKVECPKVEIISADPFIPKQKSTVIARITGSLPEKARLTWGTSVGKIVSGSWDREIEVFFDKSDQGKNARIFLQVENILPPCQVYYSEVFGVLFLPIIEPPDAFADSTPNEIKALIDNFYVQLNTIAQHTGLIEINFNKNDRDAKKLQLLAKIFRAIKFRGYDALKVDFVINEVQVKTNFMFWLLPSGADLPGDREKTTPFKGRDLMRNPRKALVKKTCKC